jgi:hypothetical protein
MDLELFRCERRELTLSTAGCARLYVTANGPKPPDPWLGVASCRGCSLGYLHHTGIQADPTAALAQAMIPLCPRCGLITPHLVLGHFCASCHARHGEALRRRNSKGNVPALSRQLHTESIAVGTAGKVTVAKRSLITGLPELIISTAKTAKAPMSFGRPRLIFQAPWPMQMELAF